MSVRTRGRGCKAFFAASLCLGAWMAQAQPALSLPFDAVLRDDIAWLVDRGVLSLPLSTWPMPTRMLEAALDQPATTGLTPADADALERVRRALRRSAPGLDIGLRVDSARHPALDAGDDPRGAAEAAVTLRASDAGSGDLRWGAQLRLVAMADPLASSDRTVSLAGSYVALDLPAVQILLGEVDRWWGPGRYSSTILSNAAPPVPAVVLRRHRDTAPGWAGLRWVGPWGYELSFGQLRDYQPAETRTLGMRVYARPLDGLEIGLARRIQWGGEGRPDGAGAFVDALLARTNVGDDERAADPSNELAGIDLRMSGAGPGGSAWVGHAQLIGEDEAGKLPSRRIATAGAQLKHPWNGGRLAWSVEASDTTLSREFGIGDTRDAAPAYRHSSYLDGYYHQGLPIGAAIGGGGRIVGGGVDWVPACSSGACRRLHFAVFDARLSERGDEPLNAVFGASGRLRGLALEWAVERDSFDCSIGLSVQHYPASDRRTAGLTAALRFPLLIRP